MQFFCLFDSNIFNLFEERLGYFLPSGQEHAFFAQMPK